MTLSFMLGAAALLALAWAAFVPELLRPAGDPADAGPGQPAQPRLAGALALAVATAAIGLYAVLGRPAALQAPAPSVAEPPSSSTAPPAVEAMVARLAARLKTRPDDAEGWRMLARSYDELHRFDEAVQAYRQLARLRPQDAGVWLDYAVSLGMAQHGSLDGEPERLIERALQIEPQNVQALALLGSAAFERQDDARAAQLWQRVLDQVPPDSDVARSIQASVARARERAAARRPTATLPARP